MVSKSSFGTHRSALKLDRDPAEDHGVDHRDPNDRPNRIAAVLVAVVIALTATWSTAGSVTADAGLDSSFGPSKGIWIDRATLRALPTAGGAWDDLTDDARASWGVAGIADQESFHDVYTLAGALYSVRLNDTAMRERTVAAIESAIGTEVGGRTLALGRNLTGYVLAADIIGYRSERFDAWLRSVRSTHLGEYTLVSTHELRPNNWGTHAGAARIAIARYLDDEADLDAATNVFRGFLGDRSAYRGFDFGDSSWQSDPANPVGVNPAGARKLGYDVDGALVDDIRRCLCSVSNVPPRENYQWEAMQGITTQATLLARAGRTDVWSWSNSAIARAADFLYRQASFPAEGDDRIVTFLLDTGLATEYSHNVETRPGKSIGYTDWTHNRAPRVAPQEVLRVPVTGVAGLPATGVNGVSLNLTAVNPTGHGFLRVWPCGSPEPTTSAVNYAPGQIAANGIVVPVDDTGEICISTLAATDIIVDLLGWFDASTRTATGRLIDTR